VGHFSVSGPSLRVVCALSSRQTPVTLHCRRTGMVLHLHGSTDAGCLSLAHPLAHAPTARPAVHWMQWSYEGPGLYTQHRTTLRGLAAGTRYVYKVGFVEDIDSFVNSSFVTRPVDEADWSPRLVMFGDLGWTDDQVLPYLRDEIAAGAVDAMVLFGEISPTSLGVSLLQYTTLL
jgi:hypothetical protein